MQDAPLTAAERASRMAVQRSLAIITDAGVMPMMDADDFVATVHVTGGGTIAEDAAFLRLCRGYKFEDLDHWVRIGNKFHSILLKCIIHRKKP